MSRVCQVTGKRPMVGNNVSHANNKTKTRSLPNLQKHRFFVASLKKWITLRVSAHGMRISGVLWKTGRVSYSSASVCLDWLSSSTSRAPA